MSEFDSELHRLGRWPSRLCRHPRQQALHRDLVDQRRVNDHFIFITDEFGNPVNHPWAKAGRIFMNTASKPWVSANPTMPTATISAAPGAASSVKAAKPSRPKSTFCRSSAKCLGSSTLPWVLIRGTTTATCSPKHRLVRQLGQRHRSAEFQAVNTASIRDENSTAISTSATPRCAPWSTATTVTATTAFAASTSTSWPTNRRK